MNEVNYKYCPKCGYIMTANSGGWWCSNCGSFETADGKVYPAVDEIEVVNEEILEQREALLDNIQEITEGAIDLIDAVEKYVRQECNRATLLARKEKLKKVINS